MKKILKVILICLMFSNFLKAQKTYVPDNDFEYTLIGLGYDDVLDDSVTTANISSIKSLSIQTRMFRMQRGLGGVYESIIVYDLTGIQDFKSLEVLKCNGHRLKKLDLKGLSNLRELNCSSNQLDTLDLDGLYNLEFLNFSSNKLEVMDFSSLINLQVLNCSGNKLLSLDLSKMTGLTTLDCQTNPLLCIQVPNVSNANNNPSWYKSEFASYSLDCDNYHEPQVSKTYVPDDNFEKVLIAFGYDDVLDDSVRTSIIEKISSLNISGRSIQDLTGIQDFKALESLACQNNSLKNLNINSLVKLRFLKCSYNQLSVLKINSLVNLEFLDCSNNQLSALDLRSLLALQELYARFNPELVCIEVSNIDDVINNSSWFKSDYTSYSLNCDGFIEPQVAKTYVPDNNFEQALINLGYDDILDDSVRTSIIEKVVNLNVSNQSIEDLTGIKDFKKIETLTVYGNKLKVLDLQGMSTLLNVSCGVNLLESININGLNSLKILGCSKNQLSSLDVKGLNKLTLLNCSNNKITSLDLSNFTFLDEMYCSNNKIVSLKLDGVVSLSKLFCDNNLISKIDFSSLNYIANLNCSNNQLTELDVLHINYLYSFNSTNNPELKCIRANENLLNRGWLKDSIAIYSSICESMVAISESTQNSEIQVYPNPSNGMFIIELKEVDDIIIINNLGEEIGFFSLQSGLNTIDMSSQQMGVFYAKFLSNGAIVKVVLSNK